MREFTVILTPEPGQPDVYNVTVPALPGCFTWGQGREEALANAREAIELYLEQLESEGRPVSDETELHRVAV